jgi:hypothetical protein
MSTSPIVDANYRLHPIDLQGIARQVVIANISFQGVENMAPVLHFVGQTKRLVLSADQVRQMIDITGTSLFPQWIGVTIILQPQASQGQASILLKAVTPYQRGRPMPVFVTDERRGWRLASLVVGFLLTTSIIYAAINMTAILAVIQELRDNWPLR